MKLGIILQSNKQEHAWNTFRLGITARKAGHSVEIFLMSEGSELDTIPDTKDFDILPFCPPLRQISFQPRGARQSVGSFIQKRFEQSCIIPP